MTRSSILYVVATAAAILLWPRVGAAQTTVTVTGATTTHDVAIRGGTYAAINFEKDVLVTRLSSDPTYVRRTLLDFDTSSTVPAGATIQSATLTLTVHWGGTAAQRKVGVYPVTRSFTTSQATWDVADASTPWTKPGGDLGSLAGSAEVPNGAGQRAQWDVTTLVQAAVKSSGSRHTRLALVDIDTLTNARAGYRDYYPTETSTASARPTLTVVYGGSATAAVPSFSHVFTIVMENKEYGEIIGSSSAPYINKLATQYGLATNYTAVGHPSLPNYMALTGGKTVFTSDCTGCTTSARHVADEAVDSGRKWKAYFESMPAVCTTTDSGLYLQRHNPFIHYTDVVGQTTRCRNHIVPLTQFSKDLANGALPEYVWIGPNSCSDMHDCSVATGDAWLAKFLPTIINSPAFTNSVIFLVWDEGTTSTGGGGHVPLIVISPRVRSGFKSSTPYDHYSMLRTIETAWHLPLLGKSSAAEALAEFFK